MTSTKKNKKPPVVLYPVFAQCATLCCSSETTEDYDFWKNLFYDLSYGKCPYGISLYKGSLSCYLKGKEFCYTLSENKDPKKIRDDVMTLLRRRAGIVSDMEKTTERNRLIRHRRQENPPSSSGKRECLAPREEWNMVRKKMIRDTLLEQFVLVKARRYHLTPIICRRVLSLLIVGLMFKTVTAGSILYRDGFISRVSGFEFFPRKVIVAPSIFKVRYTPSRNGSGEENGPRFLHTFWTSFLYDMRHPH